MDPTYELDPGEPAFVLLEDGKVSSVDIEANKLTVPMFSMRSEWKMSRQEPYHVRRNLQILLNAVTVNSKHQLKARSFKDADDMARSIFFDSDLPAYYATLFCSLETLEKNIKAIHDKCSLNHVVSASWLPENKYVFMPDPEFVGALPILNDTFGAFALPTHIITITIV